MLDFSSFSPTFSHYLDTIIVHFLLKELSKEFFSLKLKNCSFLSWRDGREMFKAQALFLDVSSYWEHW